MPTSDPGTLDETVEDPHLPLRRVVNVLSRRYTIEMLLLLFEKETLRHKDFLEVVPNTTLFYRLRDLQEAGLLTSRPTTSARSSKEYYLTIAGKATVQWLRRTTRALSSPAKTTKMEEFKDIKLGYKDASP